MTIRYKLFRIPGNIEEFVDKAKGKGINEIEIYGSENLDSFLHRPNLKALARPWKNAFFIFPHDMERRGYVMASDSSGKLTYSEQVYASSISGSLPTELEKKMEMNQKILERTKEWRSYLRDSGLTANIIVRDEEGKPTILTDEIEQEWRDFEPKQIKKIEELRRIERKMA